MKKNEFTKKNYFEAIKAAALAGADFGEIPADKIVEFAENSIAQLDAKAEKAKAKAADKKAEGDALRAAVQDVLTDEYQTIDQIVLALDDPDVTNSKVVARLSQLITANLANKKLVEVDGRKINGYAAGPAPVADAE